MGARRASGGPQRPPERTQAPPQGQYTDEELAAAIAAVLAGAVGVEVLTEALTVAIAPVGLAAEMAAEVVRVGSELALDGYSGTGGRGAGVQDAAAGAGSAGRGTGDGTDARDEGAVPRGGGQGGQGVREVGGGAEAGNPLARARLANLLRRAHYALEATRRIARGVKGGKTLSEALNAERPNFEAHKSMSAQRVAAANMAEAARTMWGPTATWHHGGSREPRPAHLRMDGRQVTIGVPPPETNANPGELPGCSCFYGPPKTGVE